MSAIINSSIEDHGEPSNFFARDESRLDAFQAVAVELIRRKFSEGTVRSLKAPPAEQVA